MLRRSAELAGEAGLDPVHGPGLVVTLTDAQRDANGRFPRDASPDDLVVHQQDIQAVLNALWSAGAEAIQMQDQRIIATSAPRCVGNTLLLNGRTYSPPYTITAIGDAPAMQAALAAAPLVTLYKQYVVRFGLGYTEEASRDVSRSSATPNRSGCVTPSRPVRSVTEPSPAPTVGTHAAGSLSRCGSWSSTTTTASSSTWSSTSDSWVSRPRCGATTTRGWPSDDADRRGRRRLRRGAAVSPGPGTPERAGASIRWCAPVRPQRTPLLGVCLGHQAIGVAFGATVDRAPELLHGKTSTVYHTNVGVLQGLPDPFTATRYHSLTILPETVPAELEVTARTRSGVIMGVRHTELPIHGVQFHPESILTEGGHRMLANWLGYCGRRPTTLVRRLEKEVRRRPAHAGVGRRPA